MHEGHRARMLERLQKGTDGLQDHELLEVLLFSAIPRKNTNPIAHALISAFGSLDGVFSASYESLLAVPGVGPSTAAFLKCVSAIRERQHPSDPFPPHLYNLHTFSAFVTGRLGPLDEEVMEVYLLDAQERLKFVKRYTSEQADKVVVAPESLCCFVAAQQPKGIVVAHNHPRSAALPSEADDRFTAQLQVLCSVSGIKLFDHIIVGTDGSYSYYLVGRMEEIRRRYSMEMLIGGKIP